MIRGGASGGPLARWRRVRGRRVTTPTVLQMEAVECGAACLAMVLAHFGRWVPLEELRVACGVSRDGSNALNIVRAAREHGLEAHGMKLDAEAADDLPLPAILFWEFNHFVVLEGRRGNLLCLNDPALGRRTVSREAFSAGFTGVAIGLSPGPAFRPQGRRPSLLAALARRLAGSRAAFGYIALATLLLVLPGIAIPAISQIYIDAFLVQDQQSWVRPLLVAFAAAGLASLALTALQQRVLVRLQTRLAVVMTGRMLWHLLFLPVGYFTQRYAGDLAMRLQSNARLARTLAADLAVNLVGLVTLAIYGGAMAAYSPSLAAVAVGLSLISLVLMRFVWVRLENATQLLTQTAARQNAVAMSGLAAIETIKAEGAEGDLFSRWAGHQARFVTLSQQVGRDTRLLGAMPGFLATLSGVAVLGLGALQVMEGQISVGDLVAFQALAACFSAPLGRLVSLGATLQTARADLVRIDDVMRTPAALPDTAAAPPPSAALPRSRLSGRVEIAGLTFGYSRLAAPLITDFSLRLEPGARVAVVGASGSGKSTLIRLVAGLYRPWAGEIRLDGLPPEAIDRAVLTHSVAVVDQEIALFADSVRNNVTLWDPSLDDRAVEAALSDAGLLPAVLQREGGLDAPVSEGGRNLSGGERQRLEIARALVRDPSLLLLDEATSALDPVTEVAIDRAIRRRGCACLIVAHRLSTIRDCDEIVVLERGRVVQRGTHDSLKSVEGPYARLIATE